MTVVALDTETTLAKPGEVPTLVCLSLHDGKHTGLYEAARAGTPVRKLLEKGATLVFHNAPFDVTVLCKAYPELEDLFWYAYKNGRILDTMVRQQLIDHALGVPCHKSPSLADLYARAELGELPKDEAVRGGYEALIGVPAVDYPPAFAEYARKDAEATYQVYQRQESGASYLQAEAFQNHAYYCLYLGALRGLKFDPSRVQEIRQEAEDKVAEALPSLWRQGLIEIVPEDPSAMRPGKPLSVRYKRRDDQIRARVAEAFSKAGKQAPRTPSGEVSTKEFACTLSGNPTLKKYAEYTSWQNLLDNDMSMFDSFMDKGLTSVHCRVNPLLVTGRISTYAPNLQNKRSDGPIRSAFCAREGFMLATVDYSMAELHTLSQTNLDFFGQSVMAEILREGKDIHSVFGVALANKDGKNVDYTKFLKHKDGPTYKPYRKLAKIVNFGLGGCMGPRTFVKHAAEKYSIYLTESEAKEIRDLWLSTFPEMQLFFDRASANTETTMAVNRTGRYRYVDSITKAANTHFQGLAADGMKAAWIALAEASYYDMSSPLYGCRPLLPIHDEAIVEVVEGRAEECLSEIQRIMEVEFNKYTPDVPVKAEGKVMKSWTK